jgi:hypothetical protein
LVRPRPSESPRPAPTTKGWRSQATGSSLRISATARSTSSTVRIHSCPSAAPLPIRTCPRTTCRSGSRPSAAICSSPSRTRRRAATRRTTVPAWGSWTSSTRMATFSPRHLGRGAGRALGTRARAGGLRRLRRSPARRQLRRRQDQRVRSEHGDAPRLAPRPGRKPDRNRRALGPRVRQYGTRVQPEQALLRRGDRRRGERPVRKSGAGSRARNAVALRVYRILVDCPASPVFVGEHASCRWTYMRPCGGCC